MKRPVSSFYVYFLFSLNASQKNTWECNRRLNSRASFVYNRVHHDNVGTAVAQWLRCRTANRKVAGSIPAGVSGFFIDIKSLPIAL